VYVLQLLIKVEALFHFPLKKYVFGSHQQTCMNNHQTRSGAVYVLQSGYVAIFDVVFNYLFCMRPKSTGIYAE
jgi:hypothetical protein